MNKGEQTLKAFDKVDSKINFLSQRLMEYAEHLSPGNVAHHRAWLMCQAREIQEIDKEWAQHRATIESLIIKLRDGGAE
jgi:hypothetical protein